MRSALTRRRALARIGTASAVATAGIAPAALAREPLPDAELLALGQELKAAWTKERHAYAVCKEAVTKAAQEAADEAAEAAADVSSAIVARIEALTATTLPGLQVKALALSWTHCGQEIDFRDWQDTTDLRLANGIVRDLLAGSAAHG